MLEYKGLTTTQDGTFLLFLRQLYPDFEDNETKGGTFEAHQRIYTRLHKDLPVTLGWRLEQPFAFADQGLQTSRQLQTLFTCLQTTRTSIAAREIGPQLGSHSPRRHLQRRQPECQVSFLYDENTSSRPALTIR